MSNVVAVMAMPLDGDVADSRDGVADVFEWYVASTISSARRRSSATRR